MKQFLFVLFVSSCLFSPARAEWVALGDGQYLWTDLVGRPDGNVYGWAYRRGYSYSYVIRSLNTSELQQFGGAAPQQQQQQYINGEGNSPSPGWRYRFMQVVAERDETSQMQTMLRSAGMLDTGQNYGGGGQNYGAASSNGQTMQINQYGLKSPSMFLGDIPAQQGNSVYGSLDPTYNSIAEPIRRLDFRSLAHDLLQMQSSYEAGSVRISSEARNMFGQMIESAHRLEEASLYFEGRLALLKQIESMGPPTGQQSLKIESRGSVSPPVDSGPPPVPKPGDELGAAAAGAPPPAAAAGMDRDVREFSALLAKRCVHCHCGAKTTDKSKAFLLGRGDRLELGSLKEDAARKMFERVADGSMPMDGKLSEAEKAVFNKMKAQLFGP